eukprot:TRINITY_DN251_c0_g1_i3.p1 TRINITY_DN251_c0_g1~~TRINITY_DN251_c0_g1_i3.p1  ORF type:complete len:172 (+),score=46.51 TRINITY_DN251_c0_g1_i3:53-568(+)
MAEIACKRIVVVGSDAAGKVALILALGGQPVPDYLPSAAENISVKAKHGAEDVEVTLIDTIGQEYAEELLKLSLELADVVIVSFSVANPTSYEDALHIWTPKVKKFAPNAAILLVGTEVDKRDSSSPHVSTAQAQQGALQIHAAHYSEVSAEKNQGVRELFTHALHSAFKK